MKHVIAAKTSPVPSYLLNNLFLTIVPCCPARARLGVPADRMSVNVECGGSFAQVNVIVLAAPSVAE